MIKILLVTQVNHTGLTYHRQLVPHLNLEKNYTGYEVHPCHDVDLLSDEQLKEYQIVSFLRLVSDRFRSVEIIERCKKAGCKVIIDIDDYWHLHRQHGLREAYIKHDIVQQTVDGLKAADCITTTTEHFADKIMKLNPNVHVLPNAIDPTQKQFIPEPKETDRIRFGWIGGVFHEADIRLLYDGFNELWRTDDRKFQLCLGGYNLNDSYKFNEMIFTNGFKAIKDKSYYMYLNEYMSAGNSIADNQPYKRLWGKSVYEYATLYNDIDVALVPLNINNFNGYKSQIKIIEAGFFKKAAIVSNVLPYTIDCNKNNSILISPSKRNEGWGTAMKSLIKNPSRIGDLAEALHETVKDKYHINTVNIVRNQLYQSLCV